jgi:hypothetical protein
MTGRHWFRRDVLIPILFLGVFGYGLYWVWQKIDEQASLGDNKIVFYMLLASLIIYLFLVVVTLRHAAASYSLERFNPGNPQSIKRLLKMRRFSLRKATAAKLNSWAAPTEDISAWLASNGFTAQARTPHGRVFEKKRKILSLLLRSNMVDRVFLLEHDLLNVLVVDQLLRDCIRYSRQRTDAPSHRNLLILVMNRDDETEAASAAAGVVNFLGKFEGGTLGVLLFDLKHGRLYYPIDRSLQPRGHRRFQDLLRLRLLQWLSKKEQQVRLPVEDSAKNTSEIRAVSSVNINDNSDDEYEQHYD